MSQENLEVEKAEEHDMTDTPWHRFLMGVALMAGAGTCYLLLPFLLPPGLAYATLQMLIACTAFLGGANVLQAGYDSIVSPRETQPA